MRKAILSRLGFVLHGASASNTTRATWPLRQKAREDTIGFLYFSVTLSRAQAALLSKPKTGSQPRLPRSLACGMQPNRPSKADA